MMLRRLVVQNTALAMLGTTVLLLVMQSIFSYIAELGNLTAQYRPLAALQHVLWSLPEHLYGLLPLTALMGAVLGLGLLASESALTVMRAAGVSLWRIVGWTLLPASALLALTLLLSEWVIPVTSQQAATSRDPRAALAHGEVRGHWVRHNQRLVHVERATDNGRIDGVQVLDFDAAGRLQQNITAASGRHVQGQRWQLNDLHTVTFAADGTATLHVQAQQVLALPLQPQWIHVATQKPDLLAPSMLWRYIQHQKAQQQPVPREFVLALWQKLTAPLALAALVVLACSFVFGSLRQQTMGLRLVTALFVGLGFRYVQDFLGYTSLVFASNIGAMVLLPVLLTALLGAWLLHRNR